MEKLTEIALGLPRKDAVPMYMALAAEQNKLEAHNSDFLENLRVAVDESPIIQLCSLRDEILAWMQSGEGLINSLDTMINSMSNENDLGIRTSNGSSLLEGRRKVKSFADLIDEAKKSTKQEIVTPPDDEVTSIAEGLPEMDPIHEVSLTLADNKSIPAPEDVVLAPDAELDSAITMDTRTQEEIWQEREAEFQKFKDKQ